MLRGDTFKRDFIEKAIKIQGRGCPECNESNFKFNKALNSIKHNG